MTKPHDMLPDRRHDEQARQDFVADLRGYLAARISPGNESIYRKYLEPAFVSEHGRAPKDYREVREGCIKVNATNGAIAPHSPMRRVIRNVYTSSTSQCW